MISVSHVEESAGLDFGLYFIKHSLKTVASAVGPRGFSSCATFQKSGLGQ